jgi:two-component system phosphate regulon response regulator PhoB
VSATVPRILVADDEPALRALVVVTLGSEYACDEVDSGDAALRRLRDEHYDLVVLDLMMPGLSGFDVLQEMRADERLRDVPVVVMSAWQSAEDTEGALAAGADSFVSKPFQPEELLGAVRDLVERSG